MNPGTDWIEQGRRLLETLRSSAEASDGDHGSDCRWCPICQAAAVLRGERPEVTAALADVLAPRGPARRSFAEEPSGPAGPEGPGEGEQTPDEEPPPAEEPPPVVQRIEIA